MDYILGDNPFFGVNHRVGSKSLSNQESRFNNASTVIIDSLKHGFDGFMLSSHSEGQLLVEKVSKELASENLTLQLSLVVPYPHTINNLVAEHGYVGGLKSLLGSSIPGTAFDLTRLLFIGKRELRKSLIRSYLVAEKKSFESSFVSVNTFCLHNVFTDMFLGLRRSDLIIEFIECCSEIGVTPVVISQNPISAMSIDTVIPHIVCFSYNTLGYMVNPSLEIVQQAIVANARSTDKKLWAMQILASGNIGLDKALKDPTLKYFDGVLYATTRKDRIISFADQVKKDLI